MWEIINKNKQKSISALTAMFFWYTIIYGIICGIILLSLTADLDKFRFSDIYNSTGYFITGIVIASIIFMAMFNSVKNKPYRVGNCNTYQISKHTNEKLFNIVEEMKIASGLSVMPKVYVLDSDILNAYACGFSPENSSIVVSKALLKCLSRDELQGVIAHEISHIVNRDTTYLLCSGALYTITAGFSAFFLRTRARGEMAVVMLAVLLLSLIGQAICFILFMFVSRKREYLADACACQYTRYPKGLASALMKIEAAQKTAETSGLKQDSADNLVRASFIIPLKENEIFSTHPTTSKRVQLLMNMTSADFCSYEKEFEKLNHENIIPKKILKNTTNIPIKDVEKPADISTAAITVCTLASAVNTDEKTKIIKENKDLVKENIKNHREVENMVRDLSGYKTIKCECETILKIPPVYRNSIVICPHCKKKHTV